jgi:hypothetical protein
MLEMARRFLIVCAAASVIATFGAVVLAWIDAPVGLYYALWATLTAGVVLQTLYARAETRDRPPRPHDRNRPLSPG